MKKRQTAESMGFGAFLQILVVGVLLFAVIWQVRSGPGPVDAPTSPAVTLEETTGMRFLATDDVNLRRGPGLEHEVIAVVPMNAEVVVTGDGVNGFMPVEAQGATAWVSERYIAREDAVRGGTSDGLAVTETMDQSWWATDVSAAELTTDESTDAALETSSGATETPVEEAETAAFAVAPTEAPLTMAPETPAEPKPAVVVEEPGERWVEVDRTTATVTLHEGERIIAQFTGLIGKDPSPDGYYSTAVGTYHVYTKWEDLAETPFAPGVYLTHFVGFDPARSNGFHSPTRDADGNVVQTGGTVTLGCVRLGEAEAIQMFEFAYIGMRVEIHD